MRHDTAMDRTADPDREAAVETPRGPAAARLTYPAGRQPTALLVLGHGAGGSVDAPDLQVVAAAARPAGLAVALVTQPYRVAGRRTAPPAGHLDEAWVATVAALRARSPERSWQRLPLVVGGRSSGARVAARTAAAVGAAGVVALAFPLHPPGKPDRSRAAELTGQVPTLVVNGDRDPFGVPTGSPGVTVRVVPGARHDLRADLPAVAEAVRGFLTGQGWTAR